MYFKLNYRPTMACTGRRPALTRVAPGLQHYGELADHWGLWLKIVTIAGFDDRISSRSWTYNPRIIGVHTPHEKLTLYAGTGPLYHPVDSTLYPVLGVAWNMDAQGGLSGALGFPETMLRFRLNEHLAVKANFKSDIRVYRLADDNTLAPGGYTRMEDLKPGLHLEYFPTESLQVSTGIRRFVGRSLTFFPRPEMNWPIMTSKTLGPF
ncbi:hypothetical protein [Aquisalimonas sp.]|uniref:hypothetical protein n=1 Tax=Aquisalimonas sp. TaxID=1872621 RepID=UPI0025C446B5|nr:hypothetical protein [Aquisalimonas sp.]